jgi:hypothetical protein
MAANATLSNVESTKSQSDNNQNSASSGLLSDLVAQQQQKSEMLADEDPLLISQSLTYVTDDGGTLHSFNSSPFSTGASILNFSTSDQRLRREITMATSCCCR